MSQNLNFGANKNNFRRLIMLAVIVAALLAGYVLYINSHFRIVGTNPKTNRVATITPFLNVEFNRPLSEKGLSVSMKPDAIGSFYIQGNTLYITLNNPLTLGVKYALNINSVYDSSGEALLHKAIHFRPADIAFSALPRDQQAAILKKGPEKADQNHEPTFTGLNAFIDDGLTTDQVNALIKAFIKYAPSAQSIDVDSGSLSPDPHDPNTASPFTINFRVTIGSISYKATASYSDLSSIQLLIMDVSGKPVFDSGKVIGGSQ